MERILFVAEYKIRGNTGGVGRVGATLAKGFISRGHAVYYYAVDKTEEPTMDGVDQYYCINHRDVTCQENIEHLSGLLKKLQITVIVNHSGFHYTIQQLLAAVKQPGIILITEHHNCIRCLYENYQQIITSSFGSRRWFPLLNNSLSWWILKKIFRHRFAKTLRYILKESDQFIVLSEAFKKELNFFIPGASLQKVTAITNPAPFAVQENAAINKENRLLFIGVLKTNQKRVERLIDIWDSLSRKYKDWHLDILGEGPERKMLETAFKEKNMERYHFHGFADPRPFLEKAKVSLLTSDFEGFGMVLVESQAYGVVPVAFDCFASIQEIITHNANGVLVPPYQMDTYIASVDHLMHNETERFAMSKHAMVTVQKFSLDHVISQWENLFNRLKNNNG